MRQTLGFLTLLFGTAVAGFAGQLPAEEPTNRETWHVVTAQGVPFESVHTIRERRTDGTLRFVQEARTLIDLLGQRQESRETFECIVTAALEPLSCRVHSHSQSGDVTAEGIVKNADLLLTLRRGDMTLERRIPLGKKPLFSVCLADALAQRGPDREAVRFSILDTNSWTSEGAIARRLPDVKDEKRWNVAFDKGYGHGAWSLDQSGILEHAEITAPNRVVRRATQQTAGELKHLKFADRDLFLFPVEQNLPFPARSKSITVKLTWKGVPFEQLQLEDSRQRLRRHAHDQDRYEAELRLEQPAAMDAPAALPVTAAEFAPYLTESQFIRPNHPQIRDQARKWTTGCTTTLDAVRRLTHEVSNYLHGGEMIAETLSGPEVLACRKGKCAEFTTLLASLTRSVGVPTRVALGMRLVAGRWCGHMWCEVWVGRWIPVDASADEVGGSPALLKLVHSDTEMGTQRVRWALTDSLAVKILDVEPGTTPEAKLKTGIVGQTYTNADFDCRITAPDANWRLIQKPAPGTVRVQFKMPGKFEKEPVIEFVAFGLPSKLDPAVLVNARKSRFAGMYKGFEVVADEEKSVGRLEGRLFVFRRTDAKAPNEKVLTTEVLWTDEQSGYLLVLSADEKLHDAVRAQLDALLAGFETGYLDEKKPDDKSK